MTEQSELIPSTPGQQLARERCRQRLSLYDVSRALHLPRSVIEAIESDSFNSLASIYRRGYLINYARHLGLDPEPLLEQIGDAQDVPLKSVLPARGTGPRFERFLKIATYVLVTTVIVPPLVWFFVQGGSRVFEREIAHRPVPENTEVERAADRVGGRIAQALALDEPAAEKSGTGHLSASTVPLQAIRPLRETEATARQSAGDAVASSAAMEADPRSELELELSEDSWVEITGSDGERLEFGLLRSGTARSYQGLAPFQILVGRANAVRMKLDGEPVRFEGDERADVTQFELGSSPDSGS